MNNAGSNMHLSLLYVYAAFLLLNEQYLQKSLILFFIFKEKEFDSYLQYNIAKDKSYFSHD